MHLLKDASMALWKVRENAERWHIAPEMIAFGGFSTGGTAAAILGTKWNSTDLGRKMDMPYGINKPNALILGYAPLVFDRKREKTGKTNLKPGALIEENREEINTYRFVGKHTLLAFIWLTYEGTKVPCSNALLFAAALNEDGIPFELNIFQHGEHGPYTATDLTMYGNEIPVNTDRWIDMCSSWLRKLFDF